MRTNLALLAFAIVLSLTTPRAIAVESAAAELRAGTAAIGSESMIRDALVLADCHITAARVRYQYAGGGSLALSIASDPIESAGAAAERDAPAESDAPRFGKAGSTRLQFIAGYASDFDDAHQFGGGIGMSWFVVDRVSIDLELLGWGFSQPEQNAAGGNLNLLFRWHFFERDAWTIYVDGGVGILVTSDDVPSDGTSFNFTPQVGVGVSWEVVDDIRLMAGLRWYHTSNARLSSDNPGRDSLHIYAMLSVPFPG